MQRVLIIGSGGAGKTTLAMRLSGITGLPVIHLDMLFWRPGWVPPDPDEWAATTADLVKRDRWIMDGNYGGTMPARLAACDTVLFLDLPRLVCIWSVLRRQLEYRGRVRPSLPAGCTEQITLNFLHWIWTFPNRRKPGILRLLRALPPETDVHILRSRRACEEFLQRVRDARPRAQAQRHRT
jgi:adenylate kinase family enzyme